MTTERIDHTELAGNAIGRALTLAEDEEATSITHAFIANARATLALVEQQRIANLIALAGLPGTNGFEDAAYEARTAALMDGLLDSETVAAVPGYGPAGIEERVFIRTEIREGLGL